MKNMSNDQFEHEMNFISNKIAISFFKTDFTSSKSKADLIINL